MSYAIRFAPQAAKQVGSLDPLAARRIRSFLEEKLARLDNPRQLGRKLVDPSFWRYRVGDYRTLAAIDDDRVLVLVVDIAHRREGYRNL